MHFWCAALEPAHPNRYDDETVPFWCITILRYVAVTLVAVFVSLFLAFELISRVIAPHDDSPALGIAWFMLAALLSSLITPVSLGLTAEMIERKVYGRRFKWLKALLRCGLALPIVLGPAYFFFFIWGRVGSGRPSHWAAKETFLFCVSSVFAYLALRIKRSSPARPE
jgi:hypothetical protein